MMKSWVTHLLNVLVTIAFIGLAVHSGIALTGGSGSKFVFIISSGVFIITGAATIAKYGKD